MPCPEQPVIQDFAQYYLRLMRIIDNLPVRNPDESGSDQDMASHVGYINLSDIPRCYKELLPRPLPAHGTAKATTAPIPRDQVDVRQLRLENFPAILGAIYNATVIRNEEATEKSGFRLPRRPKFQGPIEVEMTGLEYEEGIFGHGAYYD